jgi:2-polyprenyl-3-methyl-5-hydroxy-6-metoxy-1,4-benzoquinol methylase
VQERFACKLCRSDTTRRHYELRGATGHPFAAAECGRCGLFQAVYDWQAREAPQVTEAFDEASERELWGSAAELEAHRNKGAHFARMLDARGLVRGARILDVGCGKGFFLDECVKLGAAHVTGQEFRNIDIAYARDRLGLEDVRSSELHDRRAWRDSEFDAVCSFDVIEHVDDLQGFMDDCMRVVRPGGVLAHAAPGYDSISNRAGRALVRARIRRPGTVLCNLTEPTGPSGGPHVSIFGLEPLRWVASQYRLSLVLKDYVASYSYSDRHYAALLPGLRLLPARVGARVFKLVRSRIRNKLVFIAEAPGA